MSAHLYKAKEPVMYRLTGVLIHMGVEADEGHYVAHILVRKKGFPTNSNDCVLL